MKRNHKLILFFHWYSLLLMPIFYFLVFAILSAFNYSLTEKDLISHAGRIVFVNTVDATSKKMELKYGKGHSVIIGINNKPNLVFIRSTKSGSPYERLILSRIKPMDSVTIFTNPVIFKTRLYVEKLVKNKQEVIPYLGEIQKKTSLNLLIISSLFFAGLSMVYFLLLKRRYLKLQH
ncbi:hypothetical protein [Pedobacter arcticus]|uniref:hypothetical protein n=1 Tax=Pedobacter arcticus TaxID=752140 RepID=UPI000362E124|nr:hypothetical protein [Pedobacter arcticus]